MLAVILALASGAYAFGTGGARITMQNHSFQMVAPEGWVIDNYSGKSDGIPVVFYPKGKTWADSDVVMYANVSERKPKETLRQAIDLDISQFRKASPRLDVQDAPAIALPSGKKAVVKHFSNDAYGNFEAVAYIEEPRSTVIIVLTTKDKKKFDSSLASYRLLVKSYRPAK